MGIEVDELPHACADKPVHDEAIVPVAYHFATVVDPIGPGIRSAGKVHYGKVAAIPDEAVLCDEVSQRIVIIKTTDYGASVVDSPSSSITGPGNVELLQHTFVADGKSMA